MEKDRAIVVNHVRKNFKIYTDKSNSAKEKLLFFKRNRYDVKCVLNDISFSIAKGEAVGLIGKNGCGKSTTLKLINRIMYPTAGKIDVCGKVSSLIELGAGFHPDMTGRENIYINASIFGLTKKQIDEKLEDIIAFSELGDQIDTPVRTYSSGMYMRLAFSVAINVDADILLIDEILAVGDVSFQKKCFQRLREIKYAGTTIVIVSHSLGQLEQICDRCIWLDQGKVRESGKPKEVHAHYLKELEENSQRHIQQEASGKVDIYDRNSFCGHSVIRSGSGAVFFTNVFIKNEKNAPESVFSTGENMCVEYYFQKAEQAPLIRNVNFAIRIYREDNTHCFGTNMLAQTQQRADITQKTRFCIRFPKLVLLSGNYMIDVDMTDENGIMLDSIHDSAQFVVQNEDDRTGICDMQIEWSVC